MRDEGYIKFRVHRKAKPITIDEELLRCRQVLYEAGLIGAYPDGTGFGNISKRVKKGSSAFWITATASGHLQSLSANEIVLVEQCSPISNELWCAGAKNPSSESMTHYVVYNTLPRQMGVVHVHHKKMWKKLLTLLPHTAADVAYGTPEMAKAVQDLLHLPQVRQAGIFAMAGHEEGIMAFGESLEKAVKNTLRFLEEQL